MGPEREVAPSVQPESDLGKQAPWFLRAYRFGLVFALSTGSPRGERSNMAVNLSVCVVTPCAVARVDLPSRSLRPALGLPKAMFQNLTSKKAVLEAVAEYDRLGLASFLASMVSGKRGATTFCTMENTTIDSKANVGLP